MLMVIAIDFIRVFYSSRVSHKGTPTELFLAVFISPVWSLGLNIREVLEEDEGGSIEKSIAKLVAQARKKQRTLEKPSKIRLGIVSIYCTLGVFSVLLNLCLDAVRLCCRRLLTNNDEQSDAAFSILCHYEGIGCLLRFYFMFSVTLSFVACRK